MYRHHENFKAKLSPRIWGVLTGGERRAVEDQVYGYLVCMLRHAKSYYARPLSFVDVNAIAAVTLTVPCCWDIEAREILLRTFYRALRESALIRSTHAILQVRPILVNEAEAVTQSYLARKLRDGDKPADWYIIMDAGGGTTDSIPLEVAHDDSYGGTIFAHDNDDAENSGIDIGSQSLSAAALDCIVATLVREYAYAPLDARMAASWVVKDQFEKNKDSILDPDVPFHWNAGGPGRAVREQISVYGVDLPSMESSRSRLTTHSQQKLEIGHGVFDPILNFCREKIQDVLDSDR